MRRDRASRELAQALAHAIVDDSNSLVGEEARKVEAERFVRLLDRHAERHDDEGAVTARVSWPAHE